MSTQEDYLDNLLKGVMGDEDASLQEAHESDVQEAPESDVQEAHESDVQEAHESDVQEAPESDVQEAPESDVQEAHESDVQEAHESDVQEIPEPDVQENQNTDIEESGSVATEGLNSMLDKVSGMTEEEIEALLLSRGADAKEESGDAKDQDILNLLDGNDEGGLNRVLQLLGDEEASDMSVSPDLKEDDDMSETELLAHIMRGDLGPEGVGDDAHLGSQSESVNGGKETYKFIGKWLQKWRDRRAERKAIREKEKAGVASDTEMALTDTDRGEPHLNEGSAEDELSQKDIDLFLHAGEGLSLEELLAQGDEATRDEVLDLNAFSEEADFESAIADGLTVESLTMGETDGIASMEDSIADEIASMEGFSAEESLGIISQGNDARENASQGNAIPDFLEQSVKNEEEREKKSLLARILDFFTEEDEEDSQENEDTILSRENQDIINELDAETKGKKSKKKKAKGKKKNSDQDDELELEELRNGRPGRGESEEKPARKKPPREKKPRSLEPGRRISLRKIFPIVLVALSFIALLLVFVYASAEFSDRKMAKEAYQNGDYQACYQNLHGKKLNESEEIMYGKSESILLIRLWIREYEMYEELGDRVRALDSLLQSIHQYPDLLHNAEKYRADSEVQGAYTKLLGYLSTEYGLTEEQALEINAERNDYKYTLRVTAIANGGQNAVGDDSLGSDSLGDPPAGEESLQDGELPDRLPEEEEIGSTEFLDNH